MELHRHKKPGLQESLDDEGEIIDSENESSISNTGSSSSSNNRQLSLRESNHNDNSIVPENGGNAANPNHSVPVYSRCSRYIFLINVIITVILL